MTKAQLRTAIKREARVSANTNLDSLIDSIVEDILRDYCNKSRYSEVLLKDVPITLVASTSNYALPVGFQNLKSVRFGIGPTALRYYPLREATENVSRFSNYGYPMYFERIAGPGIFIYPGDSIRTTDTLQIDYYADPVSLYSLETDVFPIPRLESAVKKDAIARVQRFHSANNDSQLTDGDSKGSFIAAESAS